MLSFLKAFLPKPKVHSLAALQQLLESEAAYLAQRSIVDFTRNELGMLSSQAFGDQRFQDRLAVSRWDGFAGILADMIVLTQACLQSAGVPRDRLDGRLGDLYVAILAAHPVPDHRPHGWEPEIAALRARLASRAPDEPASPQAYAQATGARIFETLPFAPRDPVENRMVLCNAFAFGLIAFNDRLRRLLVAPSVRDELLAA